jgi:hypothetical protein
MKTLKYLIIAALFSTVIVSCKKDEVVEEHTHTVEPTYGSLIVKFENKVGASALVLNGNQYINNADTFTVSTFNYYISNIKLTATDNSVYTETESYHLVKAEDAESMQFTLANVPAKNYSSITFMIGVDSARNMAGAQTGALDPSNGHFWSWNSGYIMAKLEGNSPQSTAVGNGILFHVGGFTGVNSVLKTVTLPLTINANVSKTITPKVFLKADVAEWFAPNTVNFSTLNTIHMPGANAKIIADNYANMFSVTQVVN